RILVLCGGRVSGIVNGSDADKNEVGLMMTRVGGGKAAAGPTDESQTDGPQADGNPAGGEAHE
ncbi:MAG: hypothetical protein IIY82_08350, partial [Firmicutes bacterium]|nr:hypothetical protein [Bacillota bacterium]